MTRGDVFVARLPHPSGVRGKRRPVVVIQADSYSAVVGTVVVAEITTNLSLANDPACIPLDPATADGQAAGVIRPSVLSCLALMTVNAHQVGQNFGSLPPALMQRLDGCLKAALGLP